MWHPQEDSDDDTGFSLDELAQMIAAFKAKSAKRPEPAPMRAQSARPTKESLEALGFRVLPSRGNGYILPMGRPSKSR